MTFAVTITRRMALGLAAATAVAALLAAPLSTAAFAQDAEKVVNVYNWADYIGETTIADFEKETGIKVVYDTYDASESVDAKLMAGHSGYDVVLHGSNFIQRLIKSGIFQKFDRSKLSGYGNLDPEIMQVLATVDPGNEYGVPYMWGTVGMTYNMDMVKERLGENAPLDSLDILFKPEYASKLADCGISVLESPTDVIPMALAYLGKNPNSTDQADYDAVVELFKPIRQYIKTFDSANYLNALPNKELCVAMTWSGDYATASTRAAEAGVDINLAYYIPNTGVPSWFDVWLIPADAPHPQNALIFVDYLLRPQVIADATNFTYYANANKAATPLVAKEIVEDTAIYPDAATMAKLFTRDELPPAADRIRTRAWSRIKTGQ
jgi:putrescine transport system substrate-binding protein